MQRRLRLVVLGTAVAALLASGACSRTIAGSPAAVGAANTGNSTPTNDPVAWANGLCGAFTSLESDFQEPTGAPDPTNSRELGAQLRKAADGLQSLITKLDQLGPAPVAGGDEVVRRLKDTFSKLQSGLAAAASKIESVDPNDPAALAAVLPELLTAVQSLSEIQDPLAGLQSNPELEAAIRQAPNCQTLGGLSSPIPTTR